MMTRERSRWQTWPGDLATCAGDEKSRVRVQGKGETSTHVQDHESARWDWLAAHIKGVDNEQA